MRRNIYLLIAASLVLGVVTILGPGTAVGQTALQATRTDSQAGVTIKAVYATVAYFKANPRDALAGKVDPERNIVFVITLDTHSGDLSGYDFVKNVILRNDRGQQVGPIRWVATSDGSHHRSGGLLFPKADPSGRTVEEQAKALELVVRGLGGVAERTLRWTLPLD